MQNTSQKWPILTAGDTVQIIAPASSFPNATPESLKEALTEIKNFLKTWNLETKISKNIFGEDKKFPNFANTDEHRFADLKDALFDPEVKAILCLRGGYGVIRLFKELRKLTPPPQPKLLIGFSDITLLLIYFQQVWGWNVMHGPGALQIAQTKISQEDIQRLRDLMLGNISETFIKDLEPINETATQENIIKAPIIGGNLTLISRTFGLPEEIKIKNKILLLEEINEPFRKVDGMLQQLLLLKDFDNNLPAAIIIGDVTADKPDEQNQVNESINAFAKQLAAKKIPVVRCRNIGHGKSNHPLPLGPTALLMLGKQPMLTVPSGSKHRLTVAINQ